MEAEEDGSAGGAGGSGGGGGETLEGEGSVTLGAFFNALDHFTLRRPAEGGSELALYDALRSPDRALLRGGHFVAEDLPSRSSPRSFSEPSHRRTLCRRGVSRRRAAACAAARGRHAPLPPRLAAGHRADARPARPYQTRCPNPTPWTRHRADARQARPRHPARRRGSTHLEAEERSPASPRMFPRGPKTYLTPVGLC